MKPGPRAPAWLLCLLLLPALGATDAPRAPVAWDEAATADGETLARVLAASEVERRPDQPGWSAYPSYLMARLVEWIERNVVEPLAETEGIERFLTLLAAALVLAAVVVLAVQLLRWWSRREPAPATPAAEAQPLAPALAARDAAAWRAELERRLEAGEIAAALEAAWWWLARALGGERVEPDWTSRELIARTGRRDLAPEARTLDTLLYGPEAPVADDVRRLVRRLDGVLA